MNDNLFVTLKYIIFYDNWITKWQDPRGKITRKIVHSTYSVCTQFNRFL